MIDPPRPNVPEAVSKCRSAGIKVCKEKNAQSAQCLYIDR